MSEKEIPGIEQAQACIKYLEQALEQAATANLAWQHLTGFEYAKLVDHYQIDNLIDASRERVGTEIIGHVSSRCFPGLPCKPKEWYDKAGEAEVGLAGMAAWYIGQVGPTAQEDTWTYRLKEARRMLKRVGDWREQRYEVKQAGRRLSLLLSVWTQRYGGEWANRHYDYSDQVHGLEAVIRYADGVDFGLGGRGALYHALYQQIEVGQDLTHWACAPQVRTFKNGRFDIWLRDEKLASKVKALLDHARPFS